MEPTSRLSRPRRRAVAAAAGLAVAAVVAASAASLGGLSADRIGADDTVVVAPFDDGAHVSWGDPSYVGGEWVIDEVTVSRNGADPGMVLGGAFSSLGPAQVGNWWTSSQLNTNGSTTEIDPAFGGLRLHEPPRVTSNSKAATLYYTGIQRLDTLSDDISVDFTDRTATTPLIDVLVQIPVYVGPGTVDVYKTATFNSPIFAAADNDPDGFFLNPVAGPTSATSTVIDPATTLFNLSPPQPYLVSASMPLANPANPGHDPAVYGVAPVVGGTPAGTARTWTGTLNQFLANFPDAVTPGLMVSLASNASTTTSKGVTITEVTFGADTWSFETAPAMPAGNVAVTLVDSAGAVLASGSTVASGATNSVTVAIPAVRVDDIAKVAAVHYE